MTVLITVSHKNHPHSFAVTLVNAKRV